MIPIANVDQEFDLLSNQIMQVLCREFWQNRSKGKDFLTYFMNTYKSQGCQFPVTMWNHFDNNHDRTNNRVEGNI